MGENIVLSRIPLPDLESKVHQIVRRMGLDIQSVKPISKTGVMIRAWKVTIDETIPFAILLETGEKVSSTQLYPLIQTKARGKIAIADEFTDDAKDMAEIKGVYLMDKETFTKMLTELKLLHLFKDYIGTEVVDYTDIRRLLDWAREAYARGESENAERIFSEVISADPDNIEARYFRARCEIDKGRLEDAEKDLEHILSREGNNIDALSLLAHLYHLRGESQREMEAYHRILKADPKDVDAWVNLGVVFAETGDEERAITCFRQATSISNSDARAWSNLGILLRRKNQMDDAREAFARVVEITPDDEQAWVNLISASMALNDIIRARSDAARFEGHEPKTMEGNIVLAWVYYAAGDQKSADRYLGRAKSINPEAEKVWRDLVPEGVKPEPPKEEVPPEHEEKPMPEIVKVREESTEQIPGEKQDVSPGVEQKAEEAHKEGPVEPQEEISESKKEEISSESFEEYAKDEEGILVEREEPLSEVKLEIEEVSDTTNEEEIDAMLDKISAIEHEQIEHPSSHAEVSPPSGPAEETQKDLPPLKESGGLGSPGVQQATLPPQQETGVPAGVEPSSQSSVEDILALLEREKKPPVIPEEPILKPQEKEAKPPETGTGECVLKETGSVEDILALLGDTENKALSRPPVEKSEPLPGKDGQKSVPGSERKIIPPIEPPTQPTSSVNDILSLLSAPVSIPEKAIEKKAPDIMQERKRPEPPIVPVVEEGFQPTSAEHLNAARMLLVLGEHEEVKKLFSGEKAMEGSMLVASSLIVQGMGREAYAILKDMPSSQDVVRGRVSALIQMGEWRSVLNELTYFSDGTEKTILMVIALMHLRKYDDALKVLESLPGGVALFTALRGIILHKAGRLDEALEAYNTAVNQEPTLFFAWHNMGIIYMKKGEKEEGEVCLENAQEIWNDYLSS